MTASAHADQVELVVYALEADSPASAVEGRFYGGLDLGWERDGFDGAAGGADESGGGGAR